MSNEYSRYVFMAFCIIWAIFCQQQVWWSSVGRFLTGALVSGKAKHEREVRKKSGTWQSLKTSHFPTTLKAHKLDRQLNRTTFMEAEIGWTTEKIQRFEQMISVRIWTAAATWFQSGLAVSACMQMQLENSHEKTGSTVALICVALIMKVKGEIEAASFIRERRQTRDKDAYWNTLYFSWSFHQTGLTGWWISKKLEKQCQINCDLTWQELM